MGCLLGWPPSLFHVVVQCLFLAVVFSLGDYGSDFERGFRRIDNLPVRIWLVA